MVVAILFCLINNEVMVQLKKFCGDRFTDNNRAPQSMAMTQYTVRNNNQLTLQPHQQLHNGKDDAHDDYKFAQ